MTLDPQMRAQVFFREGCQWFDAQDFREAKTCLETAARLWPEDPTILTKLGITLLELGNRKQAWTCLHRAFRLFQQVDNQVDVARTLLHLGDVLMNSKKPKKAQIYYHRAYKTAKACEKTEVIANCMQRIAGIDMEQGAYQDALQSLNHAVHLKKASGELNGLAQYYCDIAAIYERLGDVPHAQQYYEIASEMTNDVEDELARYALPVALMGLGRLWEVQDRVQMAVDYYQMAVVFAEIIGDQEQLLQALNHFILALSGQSHTNQIHKDFGPNRWLWEQLGEEQSHALRLLLCGVRAQQSGSFNIALEYFQRAADLFTALEKWHSVAICHMYIGDTYYTNGEDQHAMNAYQIALKRAEQAGAKRIEATCRLNIGELAKIWSNYDQAVYYYRTALKQFEELQDDEALNECHQALSLCAAKLKPVGARTSMVDYI